MNSTSEPMATIVFKGTELGKSYAPLVLSHSSRGPSLASPGILKLNIFGPGVNILVAWPFHLKQTASNLAFRFDSGTSMACPHLSGVAALLKSSLPDWSPAAIKSAIMTTADVMNLEGLPILDHTSLPANLFATGAGHVNPSKVNDPGLVYDIQPDDYIPYLCGLKYSDKEIEKITRRQAKCWNVQSIAEAELNYPSFSIVFGPSPQTFTRKITNVGAAGSSSYTVEVVPPEGVSVRVIPEMVIFEEDKQTVSYNVTFSRENEGESVGEPNSQRFFKWVSSEHSVRSPISVMFK